MLKINLKNGWVLVELDETDEKSEGGIVLPGNDKSKVVYGTVKRTDEDCESVQEGDYVVLQRDDYYDLDPVDGIVYSVVKEENIMAIINQ